MSRDEEEFLALDGLVQWTSAAIRQADRLANAEISKCTPETFRLTLAALRSETDFFHCGGLESTGISAKALWSRRPPMVVPTNVDAYID
jgi:hypothetical protein